MHCESGRKAIEDSLKQFQVQHEKVRQLREAITLLAQSLESKPLVVIIDELDRCRPTFAIECLERIKHVFAVEGVVFVLGVYCDQLAESIRAVYGQGFDSHGYLGKFIDYHMPLRSHSDNHWFALCEDLEFGDQMRGNYFFRQLVEQHFPAIRDREQLLSRWKLIADIDDLREGEYFAYAVLLILRYLRRKVFEEFIEGKRLAYDPRTDQNGVIRVFKQPHPDGLGVVLAAAQKSFYGSSAQWESYRKQDADRLIAAMVRKMKGVNFGKITKSIFLAFEE